MSISCNFTKSALVSVCANVQNYSKLFAYKVVQVRGSRYRELVGPFTLVVMPLSWPDFYCTFLLLGFCFGFYLNMFDFSPQLENTVAK